VTERLSIAFLTEGPVRVTVTHAIEKPVVKEGAALDERLEEIRRALLEERDEWSRCFAAVQAAEETCRWVKRGGELTEHERSAVLESPADLREFFARTALRTAYRERDGRAEFAVFPGPALRATREQRERVAREMEAWGGAVAAYLGETAPLFAYLEAGPGRAAACFGEIFADLLPDGVRGGLPPLTPEEEERLKVVEDAMAKVLAALRVQEGEAYTLDELSRMAFNPFPAEFQVEAPSPLVQVEGFERTGEKTARVPALGLWAAYAAVRSRWLSPDPLQAWLEGSLREEKDFDLEGFCALPRTFAAAPPDGREVLSILERALTPPDEYCLAWMAVPAEAKP
jgi:hypothetical protein